jgi:PDZ domain
LPPQELRDRPARDVERPPGDRPERPFAPDRRDADRPREEGRQYGERRSDAPNAAGEGRWMERFREQRRESVERERKPTPYLGVVSLPAPPALGAQLGLEEGFGLVVENVLPDSPAQAAGIQRFDVLKLLNDQQLVSPDQLARLVQRLGKDAEATLTIVRKGQEQKLTIKVGEKLLPARGEQESLSSRVFGGAGGFERPVDREQLEVLRRLMQEMGGGGGGGNEAVPRMREMQEKFRAFQESMRQFQERMREWQKNPGTEPPQMPQFPEMPAEPRGSDRPGSPGQPSGVRPADLLREMRPGERPGVRAEWSEGSSRWDATRARVVMRDADGELEMAIKDGKRVLTIKSPKGEVVFAGPVDSADERAAIPEQYREKLAAMAPPKPPPQAIPPEPVRPRKVSPPNAPIDRDSDVQ